jgi:NAD(P)H-quinone oxidoreductase subunit 4
MLLSALILIPMVMAIVVAFLPLKGTQLKTTALLVSGFLFALTLVLMAKFDSSIVGLQFSETLPWVAELGLDYRLGVDGLSLPLLVLNGLLTFIAVYITDPLVMRPKLYYALIFLLNSGVVGAFLAHNLLLFFLFYELELIPLYLLISIWGGARRGYAGTKFLIYTAVSGILVLAGFLGLTWLSGSSSFEYNPLLSQGLPMTSQLFLLGAIVIGFGIKIPLFPFHTWLPDAHVEASTPISVLLAGVLLKLGTYGLLRFGLGLFPEAWVVAAPWFASWAVVSVLFGALAAIAQTDMKKMVAYSSIGHMGFVLLAAAAATPVAMVGALFQMIAHGLISGLLFVLVGLVYKKTGTRDITVLRGLLNPERGLPIVGSLMVLAVMASAGMPGMVGFISEFLIFRGSFAAYPMQTLLCLVGTGLTAVYFLLLVNRTFFGRLPEQFYDLPEVTWGERLPGFGLAILIVMLGLNPNWLSRWTEVTTIAWVQDLPIVVQQQSMARQTATMFEVAD